MEALAKGKDDPFAKGARPAVRTTEDYLAEEQTEKFQVKSEPEDFLS